MDKLYKKNELNFALVWIGIYVVLLSVADQISAAIGTRRSVSTPVVIIMVLLLYGFIRKNDLKEKYGLCRFQGIWKRYLYFLPLAALVTVNLWNGVTMRYSLLESVLHVVFMMCVGFLEEIIFRGFLFKAMCRTNVKSAVIVSSITFGIGHIVNLLNGAEFLSTLLQVAYAMAIGFVFTIIFLEGKSLWPCIIAHGVNNSFSGFSVESSSTTLDIFSAIFLIVVSLGYAGWIIYRNRKAEK